MARERKQDSTGVQDGVRGRDPRGGSAGRSAAAGRHPSPRRVTGRTLADGALVRNRHALESGILDAAPLWCNGRVCMLIALFTFSYSVASKSRIRMGIGAEIAIHYDNSGVLIVKADFVFWNERAQPGAIIEISGTICPGESNGAELALYWRTFEKTDVSRGDNGKSIWWSHSVGPVYPLIVPGRAAGTSSTVQSIRLYARQPGALGTGQYRVIFRATTDDPKNPGCSYCLDLSISEKHAKQLADCQEDKDAVWHQRLISRKLSSANGAEAAEPAAIRFESQELRGY